MSIKSFFKEKGMVALLALAVVSGFGEHAPESTGAIPDINNNVAKKGSYDIYEGVLVPEKDESISMYQERVKKASTYYTDLKKKKIVVESAVNIVRAARFNPEIDELYHYLIIGHIRSLGQKETPETYNNNPFVLMRERVEKEYCDNLCEKNNCVVLSFSRVDRER